mmetsp:Transcript_28614/g.65917  ORF Transcript_28614/g.65917 Transcript_28614/m.65917 type:complete len:291 (-) Transcript_28614:2100-2972(-)
MVARPTVRSTMETTKTERTITAAALKPIAMYTLSAKRWMLNSSRMAMRSSSARSGCSALYVVASSCCMSGCVVFSYQNCGDTRRSMGVSDADTISCPKLRREPKRSEYLYFHHPCGRGARMKRSPCMELRTVSSVFSNTSRSASVIRSAVARTCATAPATLSALTPLQCDSAATDTMSRRADRLETSAVRAWFMRAISVIPVSADPEKRARSRTRKATVRKKIMATMAQRTLMAAASRLRTSRCSTDCVQSSEARIRWRLSETLECSYVPERWLLTGSIGPSTAEFRSSI